jgi:hypothetical protein
VDWVGPLPPDTAVPALSGWKYHPRLSPTEYEAVLTRAAIVVYFSEYEGFGMPPVEATLGGAAAVYSNVTAIEEVMGCRGFPFVNHSFESFSQAMSAAQKIPTPAIDRCRSELAEIHAWPIVADRILRELMTLDTV